MPGLSVGHSDPDGRSRCGDDNSGVTDISAGLSGPGNDGGIGGSPRGNGSGSSGCMYVCQFRL